MPQAHNIIGLPGVEITKVVQDRTVEVYGRAIDRPGCIACGHIHVRIRSTFTRRLAHSRIGTQLVYVNLRSHKFQCLRCKKFFNSRFDRIMPRKRATEIFRYEVFEQHQAGAPLSHLSHTCKISSATVERWYQSFVLGRVKELQTRLCPRVLGIDEHFFSRKHGYATTLVSLDRHHVHDVLLGRSALALAPALARIPEKHRCRIAVIDLSETYRSIVKEHFPNAQIVADRFHVVKLINHHFMKAWQQLDGTGRKNRGLVSLMRRHEWRLSPEQREKLRSYLKRHPVLEAIYDFKQKLMQLVLLRRLSKTEARPRLHELLQMLQDLARAPIDALKTLGETLLKWVEEIGRMWRFSRSNGITEGFHTKMEMLSRRAFGFRKFSNFRLRVLALCGWSGVSNRV